MDGSKAAGASDIEDTLQHMKEMTRIAENEMHAVVLSCKRAPAGYAFLAIGKTAERALTGSALFSSTA
jgi:hypothetical protein